MNKALTSSLRTRFPSNGKAEFDESIQFVAGEYGLISSSSVEHKRVFASTRMGKAALSSVNNGAKPMSSVINAVCSADTILVKSAEACDSPPEKLLALEQFSLNGLGDLHVEMLALKGADNSKKRGSR
ncbi:hypothetical protein CYMTET_7540 [Cymbomonas tetramitiformis]|uniref:Uncharacterized protein n=1 Tax=Cymbomonas tetramitiformis TaxID=36881 RepID=A0AAE0LGS8_9CHLO|nr:hypothetical protein CYMTET_13623 [Cymbomonas tetramitiformis]KAK3284836.1 hypothetical protein CYMTET_7540 [Cymbomonas tetramitiformis]